LSKKTKYRTPINDADLLAHAIPIDQVEQEEQLQEVGDSDETDAIDLEGGDSRSADPVVTAKKIRSFDQHRRQQENWKRSTNVTGQGATHMRTFISKLRLDAIEHLDEQINQWLDQHPDYEVKFVTTTVGTLIGKLKEEALFMNVWV